MEPIAGKLATRASDQLVDRMDLYALSATFSAALLLAAATYACTRMRERERRIREEQARLASIVTNSSDAIVGESLDGIVVTWNRGAERLFGHSPEHALGRPFADLLLLEEQRAGDVELLARMAKLVQ